MGDQGVARVAVDDGRQRHYRLQESLREAHAEVKELRRTVAAQARLLSLLASETSPAAPSLNACYYLYAPTKWHSKSWRWEWNRLTPSLEGLGTMLAPDINPIAWERHRAARRATGAVCEYTLNIELARLKTLLEWAVANQLIKFSPLTAATYVKTKSRRETALGCHDVEAMLVAAEDIRDRRLPEEDDDGRRSKQLRAFVLLCFDSMLRFNEARGIRRDLIGPTGDYVLRGTKGDKSRTVTLTPRTLEAIAAVPSHPDTHAVFVNPETGELLGENTIRGWFRWAVKVARLNARAVNGEKVTAHHFRHAGATTADAAGARPGAIQVALGHASMKTTERYLHREGVESARHVAAVIAGATERMPPRRAVHKSNVSVRKRSSQG